ncbi:FkbM family methyltransferase [Paracoccus sp. (in: a-proteobacteria)]|uniref:FkbM family methyltransferase n=1 Tax=Paracoccus sp. TaxID=267 RepID=UPI0035AF26E8
MTAGGAAALLPGLDQTLKDLVPPSLRVALRARRSWAQGEPELHLLPRLCSRSAWSIDVGANTGVYSWHLARWSAGVTAFEPQPDHARFLARAFGRRVAVEQIALSDAPGEAVLRVPMETWQDGRATIEPRNALAHLRVREYRVSCRRLDAYDFPAVGLIKVDVEGHELAVLKGAEGLLARDRPHLIVEAEDRHRPHAFETLNDFLAPLGYRPFVCRDGALRPLASRPAGTGAGLVNFVFLARSIENLPGA